MNGRSSSSNGRTGSPDCKMVFLPTLLSLRNTLASCICCCLCLELVPFYNCAAADRCLTIHHISPSRLPHGCMMPLYNSHVEYPGCTQARCTIAHKHTQSLSSTLHQTHCTICSQTNHGITRRHTALLISQLNCQMWPSCGAMQGTLLLVWTRTQAATLCWAAFHKFLQSTVPCMTITRSLR